MNLQIIVGSVRKGRMAIPVAQWVDKVASRYKNIKTEVIDLKEWELPFFNLEDSPITGDYKDENQIRWAKKIDEADAFIFISPEYNHGYTAVLKNAIDYLYREWNKKPASIVTYGGVDGARSAEQLRQVMIEVKLVPLREAVHIHNVWGKVKGRKFSAEDADHEQLISLLDELSWWNARLNDKVEVETNDDQVVAH